LLPRERRLLAGSLNFDQFAGTGHHEVQVHLGIPVLDVHQVEPRFPVHDPDADRGHAVGQHVCDRTGQVFTDRVKCVRYGDERPADAGGAGAAVGF
jgi:hypothetical protein